MFVFKLLFKTVFYFSLSFAIFSIPVKDRPVFYYIYSFILPHMEGPVFGELEPAMSKIEKSLKTPLNLSSKAAQKFFSNTLPKQRDKKKPKLPPSLEAKGPKKGLDEPYTIEEKRFLEKILRHSEEKADN